MSTLIRRLFLFFLPFSSSGLWLKSSEACYLFCVALGYAERVNLKISKK